MNAAMSVFLSGENWEEKGEGQHGEKGKERGKERKWKRTYGS